MTVWMWLAVLAMVLFGVGSFFCGMAVKGNDKVAAAIGAGAVTVGLILFGIAIGGGNS